MVLFGTVLLSVQVTASYPRYSSVVALFIHCTSWSSTWRWMPRAYKMGLQMCC